MCDDLGTCTFVGISEGFQEEMTHRNLKTNHIGPAPPERGRGHHGQNSSHTWMGRLHIFRVPHARGEAVCTGRPPFLWEAGGWACRGFSRGRTQRGQRVPTRCHGAGRVCGSRKHHLLKIVH